MSDATTKEVLDKLSVILLLSKISLHNYYSKVAIQSCNLLKKQMNMQIGKTRHLGMIQKMACLSWQCYMGLSSSS
jgi:hypothetical protein